MCLAIPRPPFSTPVTTPIKMHNTSLFAILVILGAFHRAFADPFEHVILADCHHNDIRLSHMAYYAVTLTGAPNTVTVVDTPHNETAVWVRNGSQPLSATFPDGAIFTANLTETNQEGAFAGAGNNGFGSFNCWKYFAKNMYTWYGGVLCNAVYDCNHQSGPGDTQMPNATTTPAATAPTMTDNPDGQGDGSEQKQESNKSDNIALGVGIGIGLPSLLATIAGLLYANRHHNLLGALNLHRLKGSDEPVGGLANEEHTPSGSEKAGEDERRDFKDSGQARC
jgi:hypothetical protein